MNISLQVMNDVKEKQITSTFIKLKFLNHSAQ